jgi:hypothetical protein
MILQDTMMQLDGNRMGTAIMSFSKPYRQTEPKGAGGLRGAVLSFKGGFGADVLEGTPCAKGGYFVIRKGPTVPRPDFPLRPSSNAFLTKLHGHPNKGAYELRIGVRTTTTNYEKGVN